MVKQHKRLLACTPSCQVLLFASTSTNIPTLLCGFPSGSEKALRSQHPYIANSAWRRYQVVPMSCKHARDAMGVLAARTTFYQNPRADPPQLRATRSHRDRCASCSARILLGIDKARHHSILRSANLYLRRSRLQIVHGNPDETNYNLLRLPEPLRCPSYISGQQKNRGSLCRYVSSTVCAVQLTRTAGGQLNYVIETARPFQPKHDPEI
jgi:hypothetical protein